ncbi:MAG TPA: DUF4058 family protein [Pirellulales bacterium]|jgi:hypothetical protein|nr:DUF4058 family protein [Pirellulales bacterium]
MPLRDHFHPPISKRSSWEGFHGGWPMRIVEELAPRLPDGFVAEPRVHLGSYYEINVKQDPAYPALDSSATVSGSVAASIEACPAPTLTVDADFPEQYAYEVLIFDLERQRRLVAAVEIISPANKDRPESRQLFVAKCFNLLRHDVCVSIIDLITIRQFNLYAELMALLGHSDPVFDPPPSIYAVTCRKRTGGRRTKLDSWFQPLAIGQPLPSLPLWLSETQTVSLDLEASYEETCRVLRIR